jgi:MFS family permease
MIRRIRGRLAAVHPQLHIYLLAIALASGASGMWETSFNNFLNDVFHIGPAQRGMLEFPRELPGLLSALGIGVLSFLPETVSGAVAYGLAALGMFGVALFGTQWIVLVIFMIVWSSGTHLMQSVGSSLTMSFATTEKRGRRMGQVGAIGGIGTIGGCLIVWLLGRVHSVGGHVSLGTYRQIFCIGAAAFMLAAIMISRLRKVGLQHARPRLLIRRRYWLYYLLECLYGARKQVFLTFGPWVLIKIFHEPPATFAKLWIVSAVIGIFFSPAVGQLIDRFGERTILMVDALLIFVVCIAYGFSESFFGNVPSTVYILYAAYVTDQLIFGVSMARATYISKTVTDPEHLAPTLSIGVSANHAVSMSIPTAGGLLWEKYGYQWVFMVGGLLAIIMLFFASLVRVPNRLAAAMPESPGEPKD